MNRRDFIRAAAFAAIAPKTMRNDLAYPDAHWTRTEKGVFECDADYYAKSGGILEPMPRYERMYAAK